MKDHERIEREVERTLACFGKADRLEYGPWFNAQLMGRMRDSKEGDRTFSRLSGLGLLRPVLPVAIVVINAVAVALALRSGSSDAENREMKLAALAERYSLDGDAYGFFRIETEVRK